MFNELVKIVELIANFGGAIDSIIKVSKWFGHKVKNHGFKHPRRKAPKYVSNELVLTYL